eukprot:TRINITY_DN1853_c0_g2_i9.p4 TRINITY_DN1853_c0_g2~~TRINITY_DN1853_c0_g2_i9.p4  ORF type:complete len:105 (+),score=1.38 TRINITY_DN1853_c0_g2_i9:670-984(+)
MRLCLWGTQIHNCSSWRVLREERYTLHPAAAESPVCSQQLDVSAVCGGSATSGGGTLVCLLSSMRLIMSSNVFMTPSPVLADVNSSGKWCFAASSCASRLLTAR